MSSYVVLARKWRPAQFSDIVGQSSVVKTFMNAVKQSRIHQAYLFTGSRGVGKTSIARIFSKALRCENLQWKKDSTNTDWLESCDQCSNCKEITAGNSVDVQEIDGASNNGVDAIREIRENVRYLPSSGTRKVYIIDEVHMLTTAAFNALLKTLEEPPEHVVFIFATTEPYKIPATILSRCQRFDFKRVTVANILGRLEQICSAEGVKADTPALALLAKAAEGSMRDALSLLDQVIAFCGNQLTAEGIRESTGTIGNGIIFEIIQSVFNRNAAQALEKINTLYIQGHDLKVFTKSAIETLHAILLLKSGGTDSLLPDFSAEEIHQLRQMMGARELEEVEMIFQAFHQTQESIARSSQPKLLLDVLFIKCALADALVEVPNAVSPAVTTSTAGAASAPISTQRPSIASAVIPPVSSSVNPAPNPTIISPPLSPATPAVVTAAPVAAQQQPKTWAGFIQAVRESRPMLGSILEHGSAINWPQATQREWVIQFPKESSYYVEQLKTKSSNDELITIGKAFFGFPVALKFQAGDNVNSIADQRHQQEEERKKVTLDSARNHPIIREAQSLFGGELGPIDLIDDGGTHA